VRKTAFSEFHEKFCTAVIVVEPIAITTPHKKKKKKKEKKKETGRKLVVQCTSNM
jgi:hypothetical protein